MRTGNNGPAPGRSGPGKERTDGEGGRAGWSGHGQGGSLDAAYRPAGSDSTDKTSRRRFDVAHFGGRPAACRDASIRRRAFACRRASVRRRITACRRASIRRRISIGRCAFETGGRRGGAGDGYAVRGAHKSKPSVMASEGGGRGTDEAGPAVVAAPGRPPDVAGKGDQAPDVVSGNSDRGSGGTRRGPRAAGTDAADRATDGRVEGVVVRGTAARRPNGNARERHRAGTGETHHVAGRGSR
jgi:hypothetical protein